MKLFHLLTFLFSSGLLVSSLPVGGGENLHIAAEKDVDSVTTIALFEAAVPSNSDKVFRDSMTVPGGSLHELERYGGRYQPANHRIDIEPKSGSSGLVSQLLQ
ncbi:hypothetical protein BDV34DRAFT_230567 [Aspergillus parasiticus]|uniref:Uncharacterized protein n=1 Tax=Aspergillus parasiticus TaxID=5067 RepID=A0A5N6D506_ASPPA|nr:hypothetical protein BDV34DRAFT_230567 [Aspergillus parasiticus]